MRLGGAAGAGRRANEAFERMAGQVDGRTGEAAGRAARVIELAVRVLRIPTLVLLVVPLPFVVAILVLAAGWDGAARVIGLVVGLMMAAVSVAFAARRHRILRAVEVPAALATELGIMANLSGKVVETRGALEQIAGGGGWRVLSRLGGVWKGVGMTGRWIEGIGDLPRAKYFAPPKIGTTVTVTLAALWLVPISIVVTLFAAIATLASTF